MTARSATLRRPLRATAPTAPAAVPPPAGDGDLCEGRCIDQERVERARGVLSASEDLATLAETFRVLGDPTRLRIVRALMAEELCVCDLALLLGLSQPTVSHSLRALRQLRLVRYRRVGRIAYYAIDDQHVHRIVATGLAHVGEPARR